MTASIPVTFAPTSRINFGEPEFAVPGNHSRSTYEKPTKKKPLTQGKLYKMFRVGLDGIFSKVLSHDLDTLKPEEYSFILFFSERMWTQMFWTHMKKNFISLYWDKEHTKILFEWCSEMKTYVNCLADRDLYIVRHICSRRGVDECIADDFSVAFPLPSIPVMPNFLKYNVESNTALHLK